MRSIKSLISRIATKAKNIVRRIKRRFISLKAAARPYWAIVRVCLTWYALYFLAFFMLVLAAATSLLTFLLVLVMWYQIFILVKNTPNKYTRFAYQPETRLYMVR